MYAYIYICVYKFMKIYINIYKPKYVYIRYVYIYIHTYIHILLMQIKIEYISRGWDYVVWTGCDPSVYSDGRMIINKCIHLHMHSIPYQQYTSRTWVDVVWFGIESLVYLDGRMSSTRLPARCSTRTTAATCAHNERDRASKKSSG